jgi:hypothetical protein
VPFFLPLTAKSWATKTIEQALSVILKYNVATKSVCFPTNKKKS